MKTKAFKDWPEKVPVARFLGTCVNSYAKGSIDLTLYIERVFDAILSLHERAKTLLKKRRLRQYVLFSLLIKLITLSY